MKQFIYDYLLHSDYLNTYRDMPKEYKGKTLISATDLIKPVKSYLSKYLINHESKTLQSMVAIKLGTAFHADIEKFYLNNRDKYAGLYCEKRGYKSFGDFVVTGMFDFVSNGTLYDIKTTSTYVYTSGVKDRDYVIQGSIYKYIFEEITNLDTFNIVFLFKDWRENSVIENYPDRPIKIKQYEYLDMVDIESIIRDKGAQIHALLKKIPEEGLTNEAFNQLPECSEDDLGDIQVTFKYYKSGDTNKRATKVSDSYEEILKYQQKHKGVGKIVEVKQDPPACKFCIGKEVCKQYYEFSN